MLSTATPTLRAHNMIQENIKSIKERLEAASSEVVTGRHSDIGRAVDGDVGKVQRLTALYNYADERTGSLSNAGSRAASSQDVLTAIRGDVNDLHAALLTGLAGDSPAEVDTIAAKALGMVEDTVSRLNTSYAGRPLFGGDELSAPLGTADDLMTQMRAILTAAPDITTAMNDIATFFDDPAGGFETSFWGGGDGDSPEVELRTGERVSASVRADSTEIRDVLKGMVFTALAAEAASDDDSASLMAKGRTLMTEGASSLVEVQAELGVQEERIAEAQSEHEGRKSTLQIAINALTGRDQAEAATEMRMLEGQLEAAFLTTSRMANLSILNYLR